jgi:NAD(P)-dependent dehydrogenase (short-subunit alcohol dehydrogenase family)
MTQPSAYASYPSLRYRAVLVTGGGSGIGAAIVEQFALQGARVAFLDRDAKSSQQLVERLTMGYLHRPHFVHCDLTDIAALRSSIAAVEEQLGPVRVLVNNAGCDDRHRFSEVTPEYWDQALATNLRHYFFAMQAVVPRMTEAGGGSIINMSSISWMIPSTGAPAYVTAKAGIVGLTRTMAHELGASGIRVNAVLPGAILTERQRRLWWTPEYEEEVLSSQCFRRAIAPEEVARLILFLAADDSSAITNQSYIIDAGWVAG